MALLHILNKKYDDLAAREASAAVLGWGVHVPAEDATVFFARARKINTHLALTREIIKVWHKGELAHLDQLLSRTRVHASYRVSLFKQAGSTASERHIAAAIHAVQRAPKVDLKNPHVRIAVVLTAKSVYIGELVWSNEDRFRERRSHLLPRPHPSGMDPVLARALVNISAASRVHDPFCGAGGMLIEAGLAGKRITGADIDPAMLDRARINLARFSLAAQLKVADATHDLPLCAAIVTDLPYAKNTRKVDTAELLEAFLLRARSATQRIVIGSQIPPQNRHWRIVATFPIYIHKGMMRMFYQLEGRA